MEITRETLTQFRADFDKAVADLSKKYDMRIEIGNIRYSNTGFHTQLTCTNSNVSPYEKYEETFNAVHQFYGLQKADLGKQFSIQGKPVKFVGIDSKKRNYPCIVASLDGEHQWKLSVEQLKSRIQ